MTLSIRARLLLGVIAGIAALQFAFAVVVDNVMERTLRASFADVLASTARTLCASFEQDGGGVRADIDERDMPEFRRAHEPDYYEAWLDTGEVLARSTSLRGRDLERVEAAEGRLTFRRVRLPDGRKGRAVALRFVPKQDDEGIRLPARRAVTLVVTRDTESLDEQMELLTGLLSLGTLVTVAVSFFVGLVIVRQGLRPLDEIAGRIASIRQGDLSARVTPSRLPPELVPVVQRLNDLLRRLEEAFVRERAFTSDAAHELRTPLAGLRATIEVALARRRDGEEYREALEECLVIVQHTQALSDHLLALARMEGRQTVLRPETVRLAELIGEAWRGLEPTLARRALSLDVQAPADLTCVSDRALLQMALSELAVNAADYTDEGGHIGVTATGGPGSVVVTVANSCSGLDPADAVHVFTRFWRKDPSRTQTGQHAGLGLTLVQQAVAALGGTVSATVRDGTFVIVVSCPSSTDPV